MTTVLLILFSSTAFHDDISFGTNCSSLFLKHIKVGLQGKLKVKEMYNAGSATMNFLLSQRGHRIYWHFLTEIIEIQ